MTDPEATTAEADAYRAGVRAGLEMAAAHVTMTAARVDEPPRVEGVVCNHDIAADMRALAATIRALADVDGEA